MAAKGLDSISYLKTTDEYKNIHAWLVQGGLVPENIEKVSGNTISWNVAAGEGLSVLVDMEHSPDQNEIFFRCEAALSILTETAAPQAMWWMLTFNNSCILPVRLSLNDDGFIIYQFRSPISAISPHLFKYVLDDVISQANAVLKELCVKFGVRPFAEAIRALKKNAS